MNIGLYVVAALLSADPWATARANPQRSGCGDGSTVPAAVRVVWVYRSQDHFVAPLVPTEKHLIATGLGAFNVARIVALPLDGKPEPAWVKTTPALKLPVVSAPASGAGLLVFGDGMHQTDGAILHAIRPDDGLPFWQRPVPGTLVHLEGTPTLSREHAWIGGGAAGVICVNLTKATLDGQPRDLPAIRAAIDAKWKQLLARYESEKKTDPDFAVPPSEDQLPKAEPLPLWQQGAGRWHVDAPVNVVGDRVLVASAFLDKERVGDRALHCLDASDGSPRWRQPLAINPWGGPSVAGDVVVVAGSSIGYDPQRLKGAKGDIAAFDLATGRPLWRKDVTGGILGSVALAEGRAVACATDGRVRAFDLATGERRWIYDAQAPLFAAPAVSAGVVVAADLAGRVHAVDLKSGRAIWTFDLGRDPAVAAPGMVYGGPIVHGGRIYLATCNLDGPHARKPTVVVCLGGK